MRIRNFILLSLVLCACVVGFFSLKHPSKPVELFSQPPYEPLIEQVLPKAMSDLQISTVVKTNQTDNITREMFPRGDLILCTENFSSLSHREIQASLLLMKKSGAKYLATVNYPKCQRNKNSRDGEEREINFELFPFHFPKPHRVLGAIDQGELVIWKMEDLP